VDSTRPVLPMTGGCACGVIRYEITSFPLLLYSCHCIDCQTISGTTFALNMPVANTATPGCPGHSLSAFSPLTRH